MASTNPHAASPRRKDAACPDIADAKSVTVEYDVVGHRNGVTKTFRHGLPSIDEAQRDTEVFANINRGVCWHIMARTTTVTETDLGPFRATSTAPRTLVACRDVSELSYARSRLVPC